jgi:hypothetical protein
MRIITDECSNCGTVVSGNVLERRRVMKCPGLDCEVVRRFEDLPEDDREHIVNNLEKYRME